MRLMHWGKDGGDESTVWGLYFVEVKSLFTVALLRFEDGSRPAYHSHAFNSVSWVLRGWLSEHIKGTPTWNSYGPSLRPVVTRRDTFHKVYSVGRTWVLTLRGPWVETWQEFRQNTGTHHTLTHGRQELVTNYPGCELNHEGSCTSRCLEVR